ncbi:CDC27 protein [Coemansia sp. RSA 1813]|nr:CDC27 protein [Coemansia sp. RSA 1646]KAJ1771477.1 CDC27 protein [Coemansia sp. RSA 1843]KAJ2217541.1 CDC27 protein [Coemansia sp. RSA 487]KAJ2573448.1 CDC27 protein [Coemansia sp. RSA 1813]
MSNVDEVLDLLVLHESQIVTYRRLSRELNVHVNTAKQLLSDFHSKHKDKCHATYLVTGTKPSPSSKFTGMTEIQVSLVPEAKLLGARQELGDSAYHVYSLECRVMDDAESYVMANVQAGNNRDMSGLCAVQSSVTRMAKEIGKSIDEPSALPLPKEAPSPSAVDVKPNIPSSSSSDSEFPEKETPASVNPSKQAPRSAKSFFGRVKAVKKEPTQKQTQSDGSQQDKDTQGEESQQSKGMRSEESQHDKETQNEETQHTEQSDADFDMQSVEDNQNDEDNDARQLVEGMFDDNEDTSAREETVSSSGKPSDSRVASPAKEDESDSDVEMMDDSDNNMDSQESATGTKAAPNHGSTEQGSGRRRVRKRRKVNKIKHTKNKRGMLVSQVVDEWESYSESEPDDAHESIATSVKREHKKESSQERGAPADESKQQSGSKKTKAAVPQRSILSFFGKK